MQLKHIVLSLIICFYSTGNCFSVAYSDQILGKWMSTNETLKVEVFKTGSEYKAKVIWFDDSDDRSKPMESRTDEHNPNKALRNRKLIGLEVVNNLKFNPHTKQWHHGLIYDANTGKEWSSTVSLQKNGLLKVKGYWRFEFIGRSMTFKRSD